MSVWLGFFLFRIAMNKVRHVWPLHIYCFLQVNRYSVFEKTFYYYIFLMQVNSFSKLHDKNICSLLKKIKFISLFVWLLYHFCVYDFLKCFFSLGGGVLFCCFFSFWFFVVVFLLYIQKLFLNLIYNTFTIYWLIQDSWSMFRITTWPKCE